MFRCFSRMNSPIWFLVLHKYNLHFSGEEFPWKAGREGENGAPVEGKGLHFGVPGLGWRIWRNPFFIVGRFLMFFDSFPSFLEKMENHPCCNLPDLQDLPHIIVHYYDFVEWPRFLGTKFWGTKNGVSTHRCNNTKLKHLDYGRRFGSRQCLPVGIQPVGAGWFVAIRGRTCWGYKPWQMSVSSQ